MGQRAKSIWIWALAIALTAQLTIALGHVHGPIDGDFVCQPADVAGAAGQDAGTVFAPSGTCAGHERVDAEIGHDSQQQSRDLAAQPRDVEHHDQDQHGGQCELCWVLATLAFVVLPLLAYLLVVVRASKQLTFTLHSTLVGAAAITLYRARAPPFAIPS